ncbi:hypothetical protein [Phytoactinopolyspora halophila]|uniref:hypothetical protein n=1 Tax=Phytoactinopolyspora halophila TaxID=1981511 RepID=UPI000F4EDC39|nr:hypothetical protein [Phytoactinopolyspora halophila]
MYDDVELATNLYPSTISVSEFESLRPYGRIHLKYRDVSFRILRHIDTVLGICLSRHLSRFNTGLSESGLSENAIVGERIVGEWVVGERFGEGFGMGCR